MAAARNGRNGGEKRRTNSSHTLIPVSISPFFPLTGNMAAASTSLFSIPIRVVELRVDFWSEKQLNAERRFGNPQQRPV